MTAYYTFLQREIDAEGQETAYYRPNIHAQGAWNPHEQHMAAATGLLCAELENFQPREHMRIGRISLDIFGLISFGEFSIRTRVVRAGKTIELIEAEMQADHKTCIIARAWRMQTQDTTSIAGVEDQSIGTAQQCAVWDEMKKWPGGFIQSTHTRANAEHRRGKGIVWMSNDCEMIEGQSTSDFVKLMGMVDTANGVVSRIDPAQGWAYPNLDLQIHVLRNPQGKWLGIEAVQQFGEDGIGLTSAVLHDEQGPFGRSEQILTLRKYG